MLYSIIIVLAIVIAIVIAKAKKAKAKAKANVKTKNPMKAWDAQNLCSSFEKKEDKKDTINANIRIQRIENLIKHAASKGQHEVYVVNVSATAVEMLEQSGFSVKHDAEVYGGITISW